MQTSNQVLNPTDKSNSDLENVGYIQNATQFQLFGNGTPAEMINIQNQSSSSDDGLENVSYCEEDEAKLNIEAKKPGIEELPTKLNVDCGDTLLNLTTSPPKTSPRKAITRPAVCSSASQGGDDIAVSDGVVSLSPFRSVIASKERVNRLIANIFELENDRLRQ